MKSAREGEKIALLPGRTLGSVLLFTHGLETRGDSGAGGSKGERGLGPERLVGARQ